MLNFDLNETYDRIHEFRNHTGVPTATQLSDFGAEMFSNSIFDLLMYLSGTKFTYFVRNSVSYLEDMLHYCNTSFNGRCVALPTKNDNLILFFIEEQDFTVVNLKYADAGFQPVKLFRPKS